MEQIKQKVQSLVNDMLNSLTNEVLSVEALLSGKRSEYQELSKAYNELMSDYLANKDRMSKEKDDISRAMIAIAEQREAHRREVEKYESVKIQESGMLSGIRKSIKDESAKLEEIKLEVQSAATLLKNKDTLIAEISRLNSDISDKSSKVREIEGTLNEMTTKLKESELEFNKINGSLIKELVERKEAIITRETAARELETYLKQKEEDLKTVEQRYRKLYESKGANFKI